MSYEIEQEWSCLPKGFFDFGFALVDFSIFLDKFNDIGNNLNRSNKICHAAVGSAQSRLLPQDRCFAELQLFGEWRLW